MHRGFFAASPLLLSACALVGYDDSADVGLRVVADGQVAPADKGDASPRPTPDAARDPGYDARIDADARIDSDARTTDAATPDPGPDTVCSSDLTCRVTCAEDCSFGCAQALLCHPTCSADVTCSFACQEADTCHPVCEAGSHCNVDCSVADLCKLTCESGASCEADCRNADDCNIDCDADASCLVLCRPGDDECELDCAGAGTTCPDGARVCNRSCP
ncbi:MAG TPA: hypothetical protein VFX59_13870 [Polyangiales bacterium]|nr:hypothetical protein [Polyangiales bacterium]